MDLTNDNESFSSEYDPDIMTGETDAQENKEVSNDEKQEQMKTTVIANQMIHNPRLVSVICFILLPLLLLIGVSFLFGHILASLEMPNEIAANEESLALRLQMSIDIRELQELARKIAVECFDNCTDIEVGNDDAEIIEGLVSTNWTEADACYDNCTSSDRISSLTTADFNDIMKDVWGDVNSLSFHWMSCAPESYVNQYPVSVRLEDIETFYAYDRYVNSYFNEYEIWLPRVNMSDELAHDKAVLYADGHSSCKVNSYGGAMFWFTIMTTIGYGNTAPATTGGRMLVYTIGFLSVLLFTAVIGQAGYVMIVVFDDLFDRTKYTGRLTSGWVASLFWLVCYYLWNLVFSYISILYTKTRIHSELPLSEAYWFSYISTTTIGFGDYHVAHAYMQWYDLFWIPLPMLMGFVLLANFALKFSEWTWEAVGASQMPSMALEDILKKARNKPSGGLGGRPGVAENPHLVKSWQK